MIQIDTTSHCNLKCHFCARSKPEYEDAIPINTELGWDDFLTTIHSVNDYLEKNGLEKTCILHGAGEPLLWKHYREGLLYVRKLGFNTKLITNGILLKDEMADFVIENITFGLNVSINAATPETYREVCGFNDPERIFSNCRSLLEKIRKAEKRPRRVTFSLVETEKNRHEIHKFRKMWAEYRDVVMVAIVQDIFRQKEGTFTPDINGTCARLKPHSFKILQNGDVMPCCMSRFMPLGNIRKQSLDEIAGGVVYQSMQALNEAGKLGAIYECSKLCLNKPE
ncbi:radical SAM/SPASM domain-containing protein [Pseudodesulfovibrio indicus]|uniref:Iron-sulfur cluster protein n=1 Tax=Pseudodesulfovibrio indicus TaxID=1716143 RepID=A0A140D9L5_9BACT|nr:radical SAM protein [Pseudodesulfovibrio indicus]AMK09882.1 hypothetical protein AWY79_01530 [Pseudodesulfovibrio indicus]TDT87437.1 iron-sulfur cluster protein [Pseudodesulfovibrio indicus]